MGVGLRSLPPKTFLTISQLKVMAVAPEKIHVTTTTMAKGNRVKIEKAIPFQAKRYIMYPTVNPSKAPRKAIIATTRGTPMTVNPQITEYKINNPLVFRELVATLARETLPPSSVI